MCHAPEVPTQTERREQTIARLLDATIASLDEAGYAGTTTAAVCARAGVSQGALFRHFPSRRAVLAAAAEEVARRQGEAFARRVAGPVTSQAELRAALAELVALGASPENRTWHELMLAARTDEALRAELQPATEAYHRVLMGGAAAMFADFDLDPVRLRATLRVVISVVDGLAIAIPLTHTAEDVAAAVDQMAALVWPVLQE